MSSTPSPAPTTPLPAPRSSGPLATFGWAAFLAASWTWCIGMFLPVLLVRDYGLAGFFVFAVPNVLGAAAMGWVLRSPDASPAIVANHAAACRAFSGVTIAFHGFFLAWIAPQLLAHGFEAGPTGLVALGLAIVVPGLAVVLRDLRIAAAVTLAASALLAALAASPATAFWSPAHATPVSDPLLLLWLAPVSVFGFALCPYLDLTFHAARRALPQPHARTAFSIGFGVLFLAMILLTLGYTPAMRRLLAGEPLPASLACAILTHIFVQSAFTVAAHARALRAFPRSCTHPPLWLAGGALLGVLIAWGDLPLAFAGRAPGEVAYRCFMAFYGLVFPAYVWLCVTPTQGVIARPTVVVVRTLALTIGIATPMFWLGFINGQTPWLLPGLAIVLLARLITRNERTRPPSPMPAEQKKVRP